MIKIKLCSLLLTCFALIGDLFTEAYCTEEDDEVVTQTQTRKARTKKTKRRNTKQKKIMARESSAEANETYSEVQKTDNVEEAAETAKTIIDGMTQQNKQEILGQIEQVTKEDVDSSRGEYASLLVDLYDKAGEDNFINFIAECVKIKKVRRELKNIMPNIKAINTNSSRNVVRIINDNLPSKNTTNA